LLDLYREFTWHKYCLLFSMKKNTIQETKSTCCYCGVGCGVIISTEAGKISGVRGDPEHPANFGRLCTKGANLHRTAGEDMRALHPELRVKRDGERHQASWDDALDLVADKFSAIIRQHGPDAVGFYISGQLRIGNSTAQVNQNFPINPDFHPQNHIRFCISPISAIRIGASTAKIDARYTQRTSPPRVSKLLTKQPADQTQTPVRAVPPNPIENRCPRAPKPLRPPTAEAHARELFSAVALIRRGDPESSARCRHRR